MTAMSRGSVSRPGSAVCMPSAGMASATSAPPVSSAESSGRRSTLSTIRAQKPALPTPRP